MGTPTVCMLSCLHGLYDDRIYWKEALSLKKHGYDVIHIGIGEEDKDFISEHGIRLISIKRKVYFENPYIDKLFRLLTIRKSIYKDIFSKASEFKADVYHFHDLQLNRIGPKLKKLPHQPKVIYDVHEPYPITIASYGRRVIEKHFFRFYGRQIGYWELKKSSTYDLIIATEENVAKYFDRNLPQVPTTIIYNYSDLIKPNEKKKIYDFIYSGGIRRRRGAINIIKAAELLKHQVKKFKILFIGNFHDAGLKEEMTDLINQSKLEDNIHINESVSYEQITNFYSQAKFGLAIFNDEKVNKTILPIKLFEYIKIGLPVLCSRVGHLEKLTLQFNSGILVEPNNYFELAKAMERLIQDNNLYEKLVLNCELASEKVDWKIMESKLGRLYENLLQNGKEKKHTI